MDDYMWAMLQKPFRTPCMDTPILLNQHFIVPKSNIQLDWESVLLKARVRSEVTAPLDIGRALVQIYPCSHEM